MPLSARAMTWPVVACAIIVATAGARAQDPLFGAKADARAPVRLRVSMSAEPAAIVPGQRVTLRLDMVPALGIHVYAPGNPDYIPVTVTLTPTPGVHVQPAVFPPGEDYVFGELKEIVKVYSRPFQVRQPVIVSRTAGPPGSSITLAGAVRYQACDDRVCFPPATAPVTITLPINAAPKPAR